MSVTALLCVSLCPLCSLSSSSTIVRTNSLAPSATRMPGAAIFAIKTRSSSFRRFLKSTATRALARKRIHPSQVATCLSWSTLILPPNNSNGYGVTNVASRKYTLVVLTFSWNTRNRVANFSHPKTTEVGCKETSPSPLVKIFCFPAFAKRVCMVRGFPMPFWPFWPFLLALLSSAPPATVATFGYNPAQIHARTKSSLPALTLATRKHSWVLWFLLENPCPFVTVGNAFCFGDGKENGAAVADKPSGFGKPPGFAAVVVSAASTPFILVKSSLLPGLMSSSVSSTPLNNPEWIPRKPIWSSNETYCVRISLICLRVWMDRKFRFRKSRSYCFPFRDASIHPEYAATNVKWSLV
mmetsp:Transcript_5930/g.19701  ORF Transcript_5930/g.19701 Transcript_5930/m.19701 type:complete len:354 (-) Transcript_5930:1385-2446(-)